MDLHRAGSRHLGFTSLVAGILAGSTSNPLTVNGLSAHSTDSGLFKVLFLKAVRTRGKFFRLAWTPTRPRLARQPRRRTRGQRAPPHGCPRRPSRVHGRARGTDGSGSCVDETQLAHVSAGFRKSSYRQKSDAGNKSQARVAGPARPPSI